MNIEDVLNSKITVYAKPILSPGKKGAWDDKASMTPSPWIEGANKYLMFYVGQTYKHDNWFVGLASSKDLISWEKYKDNPLISSFQGDLEYDFVDCPSLMEHDQDYFLFYETKVKGFEKKSNIKKAVKRKIICSLPIALRRLMIKFKRELHDKKGISLALSHAQGREIFFYKSNDYMDFSKSKRIPALSLKDNQGWDKEGVFSPRVFKFKDKFFLLYGGSDGSKVCSGFAVSDDLYNWKRWAHNPILFPGSDGSWDQRHAVIVDILELEDGYCGFYEGEDKNNRLRTGIAYSKDLVSWEKFDRNPIIDLGPKGSFNERMAVGPRVIRIDNTIYLFYGAHDRYMSGYCGLVTLEVNK